MVVTSDGMSTRNVWTPDSGAFNCTWPKETTRFDEEFILNIFGDQACQEV